MKATAKILALNGLILALSAGFIFYADQAAVNGRRLPSRQGTHAAVPLHIVETQKDVYEACRSLKLRGALVLQLNRFFSLAEYTPEAFRRTRPFPIATTRIEQHYEQGLDSHNWLFIAARTGRVRRIISVLPLSVFRERLGDLEEDPYFTFRPPLFIGYSYDTSRSVATLDTLPRVPEPVVVVVDAGYFIDGDDPAQVLERIKDACPDIRGMIIVRSSDEPDVRGKMAGYLETFRQLWQRTS